MPVLSVGLLLLGLSVAAAQPKVLRPAPIYSLPPLDGTWVEYEWVNVGPAQKERPGTLRISSVGQKPVNGVPHRWVEFRIAPQDGDPRDAKHVKLLVAEKAVADGALTTDAVAEAYEKRPDGAVAKLSPREVGMVLGMGFHEPAELREVQAREEADTKLGKFQTRHMAASARVGDRSVLEYHVWLTNDVPFGWARMEVHEKVGDASRTIFRANARFRGTGAKSEIDESQAK
jgi:hypothetical protein